MPKRSSKPVPQFTKTPKSKSAKPVKSTPKPQSAAPKAKSSPLKNPNPHRSFRRSYAEDSLGREIKLPGCLEFSLHVFKKLAQNWRLFLPLLLLAVVVEVLCVGLISESTYLDFQSNLETGNHTFAEGNLGNFAKAGLIFASTLTSSGLTSNFSESQVLFLLLLFLFLWLITIYLLRFRLANKSISLRAALYNSTTPLLSSLVVWLVLLLEMLPLLLIIVTYASAVSTEFLATPFYAFMYFIFATLMFLLFSYLFSGSILALPAVSAPGVFPLDALRAAKNLAFGRRVQIFTRLLFLVFTLAVVWVVLLLPLIILDLVLKSWLGFLAGFPFIPLVLIILICFSFIYISAYLYLLYRRFLDYEKSE